MSLKNPLAISRNFTSKIQLVKLKSLGLMGVIGDHWFKTISFGQMASVLIKITTGKKTCHHVHVIKSVYPQWARKFKKSPGKILLKPCLTK